VTVIGLESHRDARQLIPARNSLSDARVELLLDRVEVAVRGQSSEVEDLFLRRVINEAVGAFLDRGGDPRAAAVDAAATFESIGERSARLGGDVASLSQQFQRAREATQRGLRDAVGSDLVGAPLVHLREDLMAYLELLFQHTRRGLERTRTLLALDDEQCLDRLRGALFERVPETSLAQLAAACGFLDQMYLPVVAIDEPLPSALAQHPEALNRHGGAEVIVPASWMLDQIAELVPGRVITGPPAQLGAVADAVALARRAAALVRGGAITDQRHLIPCDDLLGDLLVGFNPLLIDLLITKHLGPLVDMAPSRRIPLAETLLHWLERGVPTNQLARDLGLPPQTAHSRLKSARTAFGDTLDDPAQRLELIVALRAALPQWRSEP
jgi:hypothetical protein